MKDEREDIRENGTNGDDRKGISYLHVIAGALLPANLISTGVATPSP